MKDIDSVLKQYWGYDNFREGQREIIESSLSGQDTLAIMPTGGGKSLCFQVPALTEPDRLTLVISPLIALMNDQVQDLEKRGVKAIALTSELGLAAQTDVMTRARNRDLTFLYLSPERLSSERFRQELLQFDIRQIVIDEAHCISQWSQDFRPAYREIFKYLEEYEANHPNGRISRLALTATANEKAQADIIQSMKIKDANVFIRGFSRPNLNFSVTTPRDKMDEVNRILQLNREEKSLIYASSRNKTMTIATKLRNNGIIASPFHAGMSKEAKDKVLEEFRTGEIKVVVATNAFGMGIDIPDIRRVIHFDMPGSMEAYYQEAGRAGRDQNTAECILLSNPNQDQKTHNFRIDMQYPPREEVEEVMAAMSGFYGNEAVFDLEPIVVETLVPGIKNTRINGALQFLEREGWLKRIMDPDAHNPFDSRQFSLELDQTIEWDRLNNSRKDAVRNLSIMIGYAKTTTCRQTYICDFFEGRLKDHPDCGQCDLCKGRSQQKTQDYTAQAMPLLKTLDRLNGAKEAPTRRELIQMMIQNSGDVAHHGPYHTCTFDQISRYINQLQQDLMINFSDDASQRVYLTINGKSAVQGQLPVKTRPPAPLIGNFDHRFNRNLTHDNNANARESSATPSLPKAEFSALIQDITNLRNKIAKSKGVAALMVLSKSAIENIAQSMPNTTDELLKVKGVNAARLGGYEAMFIGLVERYRPRNEQLLDAKSDNCKKTEEDFDSLGLNL
jgi:ATP-dependent DNA helicase RecQ